MNKSYTLHLLTEETLPLIINFLAQREYMCVSLMNRLLQEGKLIFKKKDHSIFFIAEKNALLQKKAVQGVFLITKGGLLLHHFISSDFKSLIQPIVRKKKIYCIAGTPEGASLFESILSKAPKTICDYHLMAYDSLQNFAHSTSKIPDGFLLHPCSFSDIDALYPLQKDYHQQEVLPPGEAFNEKKCRLILENILFEQTVYAIIDKKNDRIVAKAGTNAKGLQWTQIGGVYTEPEYRNRGLACYLVQHLAINNKKKTVLFVKKDNAPAITSYKKANFFIVGSYRICYT